jgi:thiamine transport system substrate-binding protein
MKKILPILLSSILFVVASCQPAGPQTLTIMTHDSFAISEDVVAAFKQENNVDVVFLASGDAGETLNKAILASEAPLADLLFGVDNTFLSRALEAGIFEAYESSALANVPDAFKLDPSGQATPVDYGDVCINFDKAYFEQNNLPVPQTLEDLTRPEYQGLLVVENPATSSPGLAFLLATRAHFGEAYLDYWRDLRSNGLVVVDGWETAYYTNFSGSSGKGPQPMVVSYATSPAAEVIFADPPIEDAPTASIIGPDTCFRQIEFVGILKGTAHRPLAEKFVDFMLSTQFQEDVPLQMFVYPVNPVAQLPEAFVEHAQTAEQTAFIPPDEIAANRDMWIDAWTEVVLK